MFDDFKELLSVFNAHSVKYLIVGGYAVSFHAQPRATKDLDLFIDLFIKADQTTRRQSMQHWQASARLLTVSALIILQTRASSSGLDKNLLPSISFPASMELISMRHGRGARKA
jgi:hypothetical protein